MPQKYTQLNIATLRATIDPVLLHFIERVTETVRTRKRRLFPSESEAIHTKQVRQIYALCVLLFCTNTQCSMPLHIPLAEAILCHGGSLELVNRLGAVASVDTTNRIATQAVQLRRSQGILPALASHTLTVVSIDNIDILQPHAFLSTTDATRSWHGTSIQCVQPSPKSLSLTEEEIISVN